jgi:toxin ParE1/3/4
MSLEIIVHDDARFDAIDIAYFIAEDDLDAADRFAIALDAAYHRLAEMPGIGVSREYNNPKLRDVRMWPIPGFPKYLIFYNATATELRVLRVLHGARDLERLFAPEIEGE